jgi:hypothetical protein
MEALSIGLQVQGSHIIISKGDINLQNQLLLEIESLV